MSFEYIPKHMTRCVNISDQEESVDYKKSSAQRRRKALNLCLLYCIYQH
jgi:hypothetical protein